MGRSVEIAPEAMNCNAPDTGNMEVLTLFGTDEHKERWLQPLLDGEIRSAFAMTEPEVASSDATNIETRIERDGDEYVINGRKWWTTERPAPQLPGPDRDGQDQPRRPRRTSQQSMLVVPLDTPGRRRSMRGLPVFGYHDREGHGEVAFEDVRVPAERVLAGEGDGFAIAQARLGPGPHPPLHALDRRRRAGAGDDVRTGARAGRPSASRSPSAPTSRTGSPRRGSSWRWCGC